MNELGTAQRAAHDPLDHRHGMICRRKLDIPWRSATRAGQFEHVMVFVEPHDEDLGLDRSFDIRVVCGVTHACSGEV